MANWIEVKARYDRLMENGVTKKVNEPYLVDALSCSEAEARVVDELRPFVSGDLNITSTAKTKVAPATTASKSTSSPLMSALLPKNAQPPTSSLRLSTSPTQSKTSTTACAAPSPTSR